MTHDDTARPVIGTGLNLTDDGRRWTREERLASLIHSQANAGRSAQDRSIAADRASIAPIPTQTRAALRAIEARRVARIDPADLNDDALGRYAIQWAGTARGAAALAEFTRRRHAPLPAAASVADDPHTVAEWGAAMTPSVTVRETISHGGYRHVGNATAPTVREAVTALLASSPYGGGFAVDHVTAGIIVGALLETGTAGYGWAAYDIVDRAARCGVYLMPGMKCDSGAGHAGPHTRTD